MVQEDGAARLKVVLVDKGEDRHVVLRVHGAAKQSEREMVRIAAIHNKGCGHRSMMPSEGNHALNKESECRKNKEFFPSTFQPTLHRPTPPFNTQIRKD